MGKRGRTQPKYHRINYEVKLRVPGDRVDRNGDKLEGGRTFSRHFEANNTEHARRVAQRFAKKLKSVVVSISKVHTEDIIGDHNTWGLKDIIGEMPKERRRDVILDNVTLDEIIYNKNKRKR